MGWMSVPKNEWPGSRTGKPCERGSLVSFTQWLFQTSLVGPLAPYWGLLMCLSFCQALFWLLELEFATSSLSRVFYGMTHTTLRLVSGVITSGSRCSYSLVYLILKM